MATASQIAIQAQAALILRRRRAAQVSAAVQPPTLREHMRQVMPSLLWLPHVETIVGVLERVFAGTLWTNKVFIAAPPQAGKSTMVRAAASYWLRRNPGLWAGTASYNQGYAYRNSRHIRKLYRDAGGTLSREAWKVGEWGLPEGGGFWAVGVGGGTGNPANLLISDDLVKGVQQADSPRRRVTDGEWYEGSWQSRWNPYGGRLIEIMIGTRWGRSDVQQDALEMGGWHCVILPGLYPRKPIEIPPGNQLEPDWRTEPDEPIAPELPKLNRADLLKIRDGEGPERRGAMRPRRWAALYGQQPQADEGGGIFRSYWFRTVDRDPAVVPPPTGGPAPGDAVYSHRARAWDFAGTEGGGDASASTLAGRLKSSGRVVMRHAEAMHKAPMGVKQRVADQMLRDGSGVTIGVPVDPGQAGKFQLAEYVAYLRKAAKDAGMAPPRVVGMPTTGSKVDRAKSYAEATQPAYEPNPGQVEVYGNVDVVQGTWTAEWLDQHHTFDGTEGKADDFVDSAADAYRLVTDPTLTRRQYLGYGTEVEDGG